MSRQRFNNRATARKPDSPAAAIAPLATISTFRPGWGQALLYVANGGNSVSVITIGPEAGQEVQ